MNSLAPPGRGKFGRISMKERIDTLLVKKALVPTRSKAQALILAGEVVVNEHRIDKPGTMVKSDSTIRLKNEKMPFVSRGGIKLAEALNEWPLDVSNAVCLDVGASTGGFTDVLLKAGARLVYALDVGHGQLHWSLITDERVKNLEKTHINKLPPNFFEPKPSIVVADVSFISLTKVLPNILRQIDAEARLFVLIKPQFEVGREHIEKGGIVRDVEVRAMAVERVLASAQALHCEIIGVKESPITGSDGNVEYICAMIFKGEYYS